MSDLQMERDSVQALLDELQPRKNFTPDPLTPKAKILIALQKIPFLMEIISTVDNTGVAIGTLAEVNRQVSGAVSKATTGLNYLGFGIDVLNFLRIPAMYLAAFLLGEKPPVKLTNNAKILYSGTLVALGAAAFFFPAYAPTIAVASSVLVLGVGAIGIGYTLLKRSQFKKELAVINKNFNEEKNALDEIVQQTEEIKNRLQSVEDNPDLTKEEKALAYEQEKPVLEDLTKNYNDKIRILQNLTNEKFSTQRKLDRKDWMNLLDKTVGLGLAAAAVAGAVTAAFISPVGFAVLAVTAVAGMLYLGTRISTGLAFSLGGFFARKKYPDSVPTTLQDNSLNNKIQFKNVHAVQPPVMPVVPDVIPAANDVSDNNQSLIADPLPVSVPIADNALDNPVLEQPEHHAPAIPDSPQLLVDEEDIEDEVFVMPVMKKAEPAQVEMPEPLRADPVPEEKLQSIRIATHRIKEGLFHVVSESESPVLSHVEEEESEGEGEKPHL